MAKIVKELTFETPNRTGVLSEVTQALKNAGVNLLHAWACGEGKKGYFGLVTSNNSKAARAVKALGFWPQQSEALLLTLPNKKGALAAKAGRLARARVNVKCLSATSAGNRVAVVMTTSNNRKAAKLI